MSSAKNSFYSLTPDEVMTAVESCGYRITGEYVQLNSYENRVFDIKLEGTHEHPEKGDLNNIIVKFYRPGRWSKECIQEEHDFLFDLEKEGFPVGAPLLFDDKSIGQQNQMYFSLFPKIMGRLPQELLEDDYIKIGKALAWLHNCGEEREAPHRPILNAEEYLLKSLNRVLDRVVPEMKDRYEKAGLELYQYLSEELEGEKYQRIHGDCHLGNLLLIDEPDKPETFFFVDFDDFMMGPVAQDFWLLFSGAEEQNHELNLLLEGYEELRHFPKEQIRLFQPLRGLRIIHYGAWIARRWDDPAFPKIFPQFDDYNYWAEETEALERIAWDL